MGKRGLKKMTFNKSSQRISFLSLVKNCNHKGLGIYYLLSAFIFGISGTLISVLIRIELYSTGNRIISPENQNFYNISITLHGFIMIFFLVMPGLFGGFGNYFVPIFQGSPEVVYPRVNNFSILILFLSYLFVILSLISEFGGGTGWTLYPPLSTSFMSLSPSSTAFMVFGLLMSGISSCLTSLNFWTTILNLRSYYLTLKTIPLFPWALFITGGTRGCMRAQVMEGVSLLVWNRRWSASIPCVPSVPSLQQALAWHGHHPTDCQDDFIHFCTRLVPVSTSFGNRLTDEPTWRCHQNPFIGALGIQEPVIPGEPLIKRQPMITNESRGWEVLGWYRYVFAHLPSQPLLRFVPPLKV